MPMPVAYSCFKCDRDFWRYRVYLQHIARCGIRDPSVLAALDAMIAKIRRR